METKVRIKFDKLYGETIRAYLIYFNEKEIWLPKKLCRNFTLNKKLGGHVVIPVWLYREKLGCDPEPDEYDTIVTRHVPDKQSPVSDNSIPDLEK
ncbi:hypothetical protein [Dysgonomonas macrotermitis]|uniref:Uncharacterized protein n=1 Tax=Dysgonomonas macrotermitis TaxID=1346286 RepID=A0A1M5C3C1_9BACT|nr:hypothetical protein [Dysgonomonas macrotermitis]SHF49146.1 hypothetical protein SAMN05444362_10712 [Dysgonomonas macrotermitis]